MQTFPSSETFLLASNSPPLLLNPGGDDVDIVDIAFRDVFGGPPKRRSKVNEFTRHSFSDTALRRLDVNVDNSALVPRDDLWNVRDEKPVFGEDTSARRRFTADDFFDDIFGANEPSKHIRSPAQPLMQSKSKQQRFPRSDGYVAPQVANGKGRQFHFSIYKWSNKGVPVVIWGSSRLSSMAKAEETAPSDLQSTTFVKAGKDEGGNSGFSGLAEEKMASQKRPGVLKVDEKTEIDSTSKQAFSGDVSKVQEANVKPLNSFLDVRSFSRLRKNHELKKLKPVIVHLNYHPDKLDRMQAVVEFYVNGKQDALDSFPDVFFCAMQTFPSSVTVLLTSSSTPMLLNPTGDDVDIDFRDVFGGPPKRRSKVNELTRHSFSDTALRRLDVNVDNSALVPRDDLWNVRNEKPVFGEDTSVRRRFTADDFFDDILERMNHQNTSVAWLSLSLTKPNLMQNKSKQ
ncbi:hypothetical protein F2Q70_00044546 [Brassica cretica]|uniref:Uncharacterized protein n=1 Tax=Brassica cretica TaxID=69181 RepID=A0A8S9KPE6_BRACR|nr:hypothetical protein F2Q70_00044546 [Brassica cretica]